MAPHTSEHASSQSFRFFDLPRELRDEVYRQYCNTSPRQQGALEGYVDVPSPAALRTCKQIHAELSPIFYDSLKTALLSDRVCIKLSGRNPGGQVRHAGWNVWEHVKQKRFNVWVRKGIEDDDVIGWWIDVKKVSLRTLDVNKNLSLQWWDEAFRLSDTLMRLNRVAEIRSWQVRSRLWTLQDRVDEVIKDIRARDAREKERAKLKEHSSVMTMRTSLLFLPREFI